MLRLCQWQDSHYNYCVYKKSRHGSYFNHFTFQCINSTFLIELLQSLFLMNAHCQNFAHWLHHSVWSQTDFNRPWLRDEAEHRQSIEFSSFISNNIEPPGCSFHHSSEWLKPGATDLRDDFTLTCPRFFHYFTDLAWHTMVYVNNQ